MFFPTNAFKQQMYVKCRPCSEILNDKGNTMVTLDFHAQLLHLKKVHGVKSIDLTKLEFVYED